MARWIVRKVLTVSYRAIYFLMLFLGCIASVTRFWLQQCSMGTTDYGSNIFADHTAKSSLPRCSMTSVVRTCSSTRTCHYALGWSMCSRVAVSLYDRCEPLDAAPAVEGLAPEARSRKSTRSSLRTLDGTVDCDERAEPVEFSENMVEAFGAIHKIKTQGSLTLSCRESSTANYTLVNPAW